MAHGDIYIILNIITWSLFLFITLYLFIILIILPTLYKHIRIRIYVYIMFKDLLFLKFLEVLKLNIFLSKYLDKLVELNMKVLQKMKIFLKKNNLNNR